MAQADVFVFPSLFEGSAVVTYEALACGLPSVVTAAAGSVVRDGMEGFIVESRDVNTLAHRMELLGNSPELRTRMMSARAESGPRVRLGTISRRCRRCHQGTRADNSGSISSREWLKAAWLAPVPSAEVRPLHGR